jgi:glutathione S-transferase
MTLPTPLKMMGAPGSPYTRKMRSLLRYRHIPYRMLLQGSREHAALPAPRVPLLPTFYLPGEDGTEVPVTDSTPLIQRFEAEFEGRSVLPPDPVVAMLDALIEDYADEWLTKPMFHYRWYYDADIAKAVSILPLWGKIDVTDEAIAPLREMIGKRQIGRIGVVGSNEVTKPVIESSYVRFLKIFDAHLQTQPFVLGQRPAACDFALYGQLTCLALFDPTPSAICVEQAPRVYAWVEKLEDLSGVEPEDADWIGRDGVSETLHGLLGEIGRVYAPYLIANAAAVEAGADQLETTIDGARWVQKPFPYQAKCLRWLRERHAALAEGDRKDLDAILAGTGCEVLFGGAGGQS